MAEYEVETHYRIWDNDNHVFLSVGPDPDGLGCIAVTTNGEKNVEYFGDIRLVLPKDLAKALAATILKAVETTR